MTMSKEELQEALRSVESTAAGYRRELEAVKMKEQAAQAEFHLSKIQHYLEVVPKHFRTSCSDEDPRNGHGDGSRLPRCLRCFLLVSNQQQYWDPDYTIDISLGGT